MDRAREHPARESTSMTTTELPFETTGDLASTPLPRILLGLYTARFDGELALEAPQRSKKLVFQTGAPIHAESNLASETLGLQLVEQGTLSSADHARVSAYVKSKSCKEGVALLALELIAPKDLFGALKEQVRRRIRECFAWPDGRYSIAPGTPGDADSQAFRGDPLAIVQEGLESHWSVERLFADLAPRMSSYPSAGDQLRRQLARLGPDPALDAFAASLDGTQTFETLIAPAFASPRALAGVWVLASSGGIEWSEGPVDTSTEANDDFDLEVEIEIAGAGASVAKAGGVRPSRSDAKARDSAADGRAAAVRAEIEKRRASLFELDYYALLGLERDAKSVAVKKAYFKAAKQYHPDTLAKLGLQALRDQAAEVFAHIAEAFEVLSDAGKRNDYDASLRGELTKAQAARLAQAETSFRKGEILVRMGDFRGALEYLKPAVEIWPEECAYQSALGWALYKMSPPDPEAARAHLERAVALGPNDSVAHFRLGTLLRSLDEHQEGDRLIELASRLEPARQG